MCKTVEPVYKQLADVYKDIDTVMIARMDATSNEIYHPNIQLEGYPTMFFIRAKDKKVVPCDVWSSKEVGAFKSFIKEHSSFEVDESKLGAAEKLEDKEDEAQKKVADKGESEDEPEDEDEPVKTIVGDNFNERIMKGTHDVMLDIYAPWCTHCKQIAPRLEAAAKLLEDVPNVMIAKCDYTSNDLASLHPKLARVGEFPTLFYFSREDPHNPVVYDGPKYADDIAAYMKSGGSAKGSAAKTAEPEAEKSEPAAASSDDDAFLKTITTGNFKERVMRSGKSSLLKFYGECSAVPFLHCCRRISAHHIAFAPMQLRGVATARPWPRSSTSLPRTSTPTRTCSLVRSMPPPSRCVVLPPPPPPSHILTLHSAF